PLAVAVLALYYASLGVAISSFATRRIVAAAALLIVLLVSSVTAAIISEGRSTRTPWAAVHLLDNPVQIRDLSFEGHSPPDPDLAGVAGGGMLAVAVYVAVVGLSLTTLLWRYRWVET